MQRKLAQPNNKRIRVWVSSFDFVARHGGVLSGPVPAKTEVVLLPILAAPQDLYLQPEVSPLHYQPAVASRFWIFWEVLAALAATRAKKHWPCGAYMSNRQLGHDSTMEQQQ